MKRFYLKGAIFLLIVGNYIILFLMWLGWQLDYHYGDGHEIRESFDAGSHYGTEALVRIYSGINYDIYYFAGFTSVLVVCVVALLKSKLKRDYDKTKKNKDGL